MPRTSNILEMLDRTSSLMFSVEDNNDRLRNVLRNALNKGVITDTENISELIRKSIELYIQVAQYIKNTEANNGLPQWSAIARFVLLPDFYKAKFESSHAQLLHLREMLRQAVQGNQEAIKQALKETEGAT